MTDMLDLAEFSSRWRAFVPRWVAASEQERARLVEEAMAHGLPAVEAGETGEAPDRDAVHRHDLGVAGRRVGSVMGSFMHLIDRT